MLLERYGLEVVMAFIKDMVRMWLHAWKRFISIALISLLGVAVLTGIYAGCRDAFSCDGSFFRHPRIARHSGVVDGRIDR